MDDAEIVTKLHRIIVDATRLKENQVILVTANAAEASLDMNVQFVSRPRVFGFLPLLKALEPISNMDYGDDGAQRSWTISGSMQGRAVNLSIHIDLIA